MSTAASLPRTAAALLGACHPVPAALVTGLGVALASSAPAGLTASRRHVGAWAVAVGSGQLVIGWVNDVLDAERDAQVGRADKPVAAGAVGAPVVWGAVAGATVVSAATGRWLGWGLAGSQVALVVVPGVAHSLGAKRTMLSPVPWAVAFGALPLLSHRAGGGEGVPVRAGVAGAALGVAAHLGNAARDVADDRATGQEGLPARLGVGVSRGVAVGLVGVAAVVVRGPMRWLATAGAVAAGVVAVRRGT